MEIIVKIVINKIIENLTVLIVFAKNFILKLMEFVENVQVNVKNVPD